MLTNEGNNFLDIKDDLGHKIKNLIVHNIPLSTSKAMTALRTIRKIASPFIHSSLSPTLSHIAIQLNLEDSDFIYIIEYGQYFSKDSKIKSSCLSSMNSKSSNEPRKSENNYDYYYINEDGARITRLSYKEIESRLLEKDSFIYSIYKLMSISKDENIKDEYKNEKSGIFSYIIAEEFYGHTEEKEKNKLEKMCNDFYRIECDIKNKITLRELCKNFKNDKWLPKKYNVVTHNCQDLATEIITILKAIRINEKFILPDCLIKALWKNEDLSLRNTIGRIPFFGVFHDFGYNLTQK